MPSPPTKKPALGGLCLCCGLAALHRVHAHERDLVVEVVTPGTALRLPLLLRVLRLCVLVSGVGLIASGVPPVILLVRLLVVTVEHRHVAENRPLDALLALLLAHILRHHPVVAVLALFVQVDEAGGVEIDALLPFEQPRFLDLRYVDLQPYAYLTHAVASSGCVAGP